MTTEIDLLVQLLKQHAEDDSRRFEAHGEMLTEIRSDVKSLVLSGAQRRGGKAMLAAIVSGASVAASGLFALVAWWFK